MKKKFSPGSKETLAITLLKPLGASVNELSCEVRCLDKSKISLWNLHDGSNDQLPITVSEILKIHKVSETLNVKDKIIENKIRFGYLELTDLISISFINFGN